MTLCNTKNDINHWENVDLKPIQEPGLRYWFTSDFDTDAILRNKSPYTVGDGSIINTTRQLVHPSNIFGSCMSFNGNGYVKLPNAVLYDQLRFTLSSWFKTTSSNLNMRLYYEGSSISNVPIIMLSLNDSIPGEVKFGIRNNNGIIESVSSTNVTSLDGKWHNIAGLSDLSGRKLYYDGILKVSNTIYPTLATTNTSTIGAEKRVGDYSGHITGLIGETIVSTSNYTDAEMYYNYTHSPFYYLQQEEL